MSNDLVEELDREFNKMVETAVAKEKSEHQQSVEAFHVGMHLKTPTSPELPTDAYLLARAKILMEEVMEYIEASGVEICVPTKSSRLVTGAYPQSVTFKDMVFEKRNPANLVEMADGLADTLVVATGGLVICGIADKALLREVDNNNLMKLATGYFDWNSGKYIKAKNHPKPDIAGVLKAQGWKNEDSTNLHVLGGSPGC